MVLFFRPVPVAQGGLSVSPFDVCSTFAVRQGGQAEYVMGAGKSLRSIDQFPTGGQSPYAQGGTGFWFTPAVGPGRIQEMSEQPLPSPVKLRGHNHKLGILVTQVCCELGPVDVGRHRDDPGSSFDEPDGQVVAGLVDDDRTHSVLVQSLHYG